jgi:hypothetical protein
MIFKLLTLLAALSLAGVAGWFSIIGMTSIYAGAPVLAFILGAVIELAKLVMISWLYQSWKTANWLLKFPILTLVIAIMMATSMSVFGFLSKAHLEQGAATIDNTPKIERLDGQIAREKSRIADDEKVIAQLDATVNSFIGKDNADRALYVRRSQDNQRKQLRTDISEAQKRIDEFSTEKAPLVSEVRKLQLDVGPIRYIGELIYGENNTDKNIEGAVKLFSGLIVLILDPSAVMLLIAFNHTLMRQENEKKEEEKQNRGFRKDSREGSGTLQQIKDKIFKGIRFRFSKITYNENNSPQYEDIREGDISPKSEEIYPSIPSGITEELESKVEHKLDYQTYLSANDVKWPTINEKKEISQIESGEVSLRRPLLNEAGHVGQHEEGSQLVYGEDVRADEVRDTLDEEIQGKEVLSSIKENAINEEEVSMASLERAFSRNEAPPSIRTPSYTTVEGRERFNAKRAVDEPAVQTPIPPPQVGEIVAPVTNFPHFIPQKARNFRIVNPPRPHVPPLPSSPPISPVAVNEPAKTDKYPKTLSWLTEFKRP